MKKIHFILLFLFISQLISQTLMAGQQRIALVIGNGDYKTNPLSNPVNDAHLMADNLKKLGFEVILKTDASQQIMDDAIEQLGRKLEQGGVGLFFYAGHAMQSKGRNYLIPVGSRLQREKDLKYKAVDSGMVLDEMSNAHNGLNIVIFDACRDNPLSRKFRTASRGLSRLDNTLTGLLLAYSTAPGTVASDGDGKNSPYTKALVKAMNQPGLPLEMVFKETLKQVKKTTRGKQIPWFNSSVEGDFYFIESQNNLQTAVQVASAELDTADSHEHEFWNDVKSDPSKEMYEAYLENYPDGHYTPIVQIKLKKLLIRTSQLQEKTGKVTIRSNVYNDKVMINGEARGSTRLDLTLKAGPYAVEVSKAGYETWVHNMQVQSGSEQVIYARLMRQENSLPASRPDSSSYLTSYHTSGSNTIEERVTGMELIKVPSGCFQMGSNKGDFDEKPVHKVCITQDYYLGKYEVTQGQWQAIMGNNPSRFKKGRHHPVEDVSWNDVQTFIRKLNARTGHRYRLPTEAEWEYACRSGGKNQTYCGGNNLSSYGWYGEDWDKGHHSVGGKSPNALGLYDMSGNVYEWVQDWHVYDYYKNSPTDNPMGPADGSSRVARGGNWHGSGPDSRRRTGHNARKSRAVNRSGFRPDLRFNDMGFRLARSSY